MDYSSHHLKDLVEAEQEDGTGCTKPFRWRNVKNDPPPFNQVVILKIGKHITSGYRAAGSDAYYLDIKSKSVLWDDIGDDTVSHWFPMPLEEV